MEGKLTNLLSRKKATIARDQVKMNLIQLVDLLEEHPELNIWDQTPLRISRFHNRLIMYSRPIIINNKWASETRINLD